MLPSVADIARNAGLYPELAGARVLVTGLTSSRGVDLVRAFAEHGCRMVLQVPEISHEIDALLGIISESALEVYVRHDLLESGDDATRFAQDAASHFGGFEIVANLIALDTGDLGSAETLEDLEGLMVERLQAAQRTTAVAANRMALTWTQGSILNIIRTAAPRSARDAAVIGLARAALASLTRFEAKNWAARSVRINAVAPHAQIGARLDDDCLTSEPDIAALALYLASSAGERLTGHIFDADGAACAT